MTCRKRSRAVFDAALIYVEDLARTDCTGLRVETLGSGLSVMMRPGNSRVDVAALWDLALRGASAPGK